MDVKNFSHQNNIGLYGLVETKIKQQDFDTILHNLGSHWHAQAITVQVTEISSGDCFLFTVVYGFNDDGDKLALWQELRLIHDSYSGPWGICRDFNNVLKFNERIGRDVTWSEIMEFRDCVQYCGLFDIKGKGAFYTWNNKQVPRSRHYSRIDRFLVNSEWMDLYPLAYAHFLPEGLFDHNPVVCYKRQARLVTKLKKLKKPLKELNRNNFSDVDKAVGVAKALLEDIQLQLLATPTDHSLIDVELDVVDSLRYMSKVQHSFLSQRAKVEWLTNRDDNTQFFHNHIRARQIHNSVMCIKGADGVSYSNQKDIETAFLNYYKDLLGTSHPTTAVHEPTVRTGSQFFKDTWETIGDDIIVAVKGSEQSIMWILISFATFLALTGLNLNKSKSEIFFNGVPAHIVKDIMQVSGFHRGTLPFKYLGVPISAKNLTKNEGLKLIDRIVARIRDWGSRHLSYADRLTLGNKSIRELHLLSGTPTACLKMKGGWGKVWSEYAPPPDCSWSWRKITHTIQDFHQAYTGNKWLNDNAPYTV
ncbi:uncharacterized protein LOC141630008 [Silene latifolia]|uniref:uncharacterized protein LOC141630008 n=1 Tax=Silene latifolia TaxID=37657 RepID=UPI003D76D83E